MNFKDAVIAILSLSDIETLRNKLRELADQWEKMLAERLRLEERLKELQNIIEYEDNAWAWLWRKCGGIFHGKAIICTSAAYYSPGSSHWMGRMRKKTPGAGQATLGAEEAECDEI